MLWGMTDARSEFEQHLSTIQQYIVLGLSEADTRSHLIDPLLRILGFSDVSHLRREVMIPGQPPIHCRIFRTYVGVFR